MVNEDIFGQFEAIEKLAEQLLENNQALKETNAKQRDRIERLEQDLLKANEDLERFRKDRSLIRSRVDALLIKLQGVG